jgi:dihydrolipoamide dehydrogenase
MLEAVEDFLALADQQIAREALRQFKKQGLDIRLGTRVMGTEKTEAGVKVQFRDKTGDHEITVEKAAGVGRTFAQHR